MRDLLLFGFVVALAPFAIALPHVGVLLWSWLSFMSPHRETFGAAYSAPIVYWVAIVTVVAWMISREQKFVFRDVTSLFMLAFLAWTGLSTLTAIDQEWSYTFLVQTFKSFLLAFAVIGLINSKTRIQALIWVIAISLGYYAVKGFGFMISRGGQYIVFGPPSSFIGDNNNLSLALAMILPLLNYLRFSSERRLVKYLIGFVMVATVASSIGTYSRGGLLGLVIVASGLWILSRHKLMLLLGGGAVAIALFSFIPQQWFDRISTIPSYSQDASFQGRVEAWRVNVRIALDRPLTGGGFYVSQLPNVFTAYKTPGREQAPTAPHSIYLQVLGDHGFPGLVLFLLMMGSALFNLRSVVRHARLRDDLRWAADLASMMQVSLIGYLGAGSLLSLAYYDVPLVLIALSAGLRLLVQASEAHPEGALVSSWRRPREALAARHRHSTE